LDNYKYYVADKTALQIVNYIFHENLWKITAQDVPFTIFRANNKEKALSSLKKSQSKSAICRIS